MNMTTPTNEEVRRQFEAWAVTRGYYIDRIDSLPNEYKAFRTHDLWQGYQAAHSSPAVVALVEKVQAVLRHRVGELPNLGYIRDNDPSRKAIAELVAALAPFTTGAGHVE